MGFVETTDAKLYWQADGEPSHPAVMFLNSLGTSLSMWDGVVAQLKDRFCIIRMDTRGHGKSQVTPGDYSMEMLAADALAVLDAAGLQKAHICGLSMGALVASHLAARHRDKVDRLALCNIVTEVNFADWEQRANLVRQSGMAAIADAVISRFFSPAFLESGDGRVELALSELKATDPQGYAACCIAIGRAEVLPASLGDNAPPLLSIGGANDMAAPPENARKIAASVAGGRVKVLDTGHLSATEDPHGFSRELASYLAG
ncbi:MAG: alpha/beta fold hydrolase [Rhizobiaceae bacterium]|nr:alpha/beta fold hydrolase [Rhizobiaceae bacterium]